MSVRISLIRSVRQREERQQIGNLTPPFVSELLKLETQCLLSLAEAARESDQTQIALNSVMRAQRLEDSVASFETSQEYANVLWAMKEEKIAVNFLEDLIRRPSFTTLSPPIKAAFYAKLVSVEPPSTFLLNRPLTWYIFAGYLDIGSLPPEANRCLGQILLARDP
jgi:serine-protein kinase ATM